MVKRARIAGKRSGVVRGTISSVLNRALAEYNIKKRKQIGAHPKKVTLSKREGKILRSWFKKNKEKYAALEVKLSKIGTKIMKKELLVEEIKEIEKLNKKVSEYYVIKHLLEKGKFI